MDGENVTFLVAFGAGMLTFASPCHLPLVPVYVGHMTGVTMTAGSHGRRALAALHAVAFVLGFTAVFVSFWALLGLLGYALQENARYLRQIGGAALVFMGFHVMGVINLGFLNREWVPGVRPGNRSSVARSFLLGVFFAAGWTPCIGPVLGAIIGLAAYNGELLQGTALLLTYSLGLGVPFIVTAVAVDRIANPLRRARLVRAAVPVLSGALVVGIGVLMLTNTLVQMPRYFDWGGNSLG
ncbi:MAG TPA: cytochrome c biogenesis protein CcdA [Dehalococcoidia bacterium]|jgi:cytochrome c-type biogenesis protein|nr:cytochrome c biogenesis protein CcdA [Dehalococcoidia bacterium]